MPRFNIGYSERWRRLKSSSRFHNILVFICFVGVAVAFWFVLALNDNVTETFRVRLQYDNVPDSVTFIPDPPTELNLTVRDKGTSLLRSGVAKRPVLHLNFKTFARDGILRITPANLAASVKTAFGNSIQIQSSSIDSIRVNYTYEPGKRVPLVVRYDLSAASGHIIPGPPDPAMTSVLIYSVGNGRDTISHVYTQTIVAHDLSQPKTVTAKMAPIPGVKIVPSSVEVEIKVENLVRKEGYAHVMPLNVPEGESLMIFPNRVPVAGFVRLSQFGDEELPIMVTVNYEDTKLTKGSKIPLRLQGASDAVESPELLMDSVEYTIVRN